MLPALRELAADPGRGRRLLLLVLLVGAGMASGSPPARSAVAPAASASAPVVAQAPVVFAERSWPLPEVAPGAGRVPALRMPVAGPLVRGFEARAGPYGPGHRGIDIEAAAGIAVAAPAAGRVVFAGPVAGSTWVSVLVAPGVVVTLGPLGHPVTRGRLVRTHTQLGRVAQGHGAGAPVKAQVGHGASLHLSVRVDGLYVDPLAYLVDRPRPRLAPLLAPRGLPEA